MVEMPRKQPMPSDERAICDRLKQFRKFVGLSQAEFASLAGLNPLAYASYEYHKSQLNYPAAWRILTAFQQLNPRWLAGDHRQMVDVNFISYPAPDEMAYGPRAAFSEVYERELKSRLLLAKSAWMPGQGKDFPLFRLAADAVGRLAGRGIFSHILLDWLASLPDSELNSFLNELLVMGEELLKKHHAESDPKVSESKRKEMQRFLAKNAVGSMDLAGVKKNVLTNSATRFNFADVNNQWPALKRKLQKATAEPGAKSRLAKFLKVDLTRVSQWLTDAKSAREPGAEYALGMLYWVEHPELQK